MRVIRPTLIGDAQFTSSTIAETDYPAYASGTTYTGGPTARVIRTTTHRIYESLVAGNVGHTPETSPAQWLDIGPTNRWAMFDRVVGTTSSAASSITVEIAPGAVDSLALIDIAALSATVTVKLGGTPVFTKTLATAAGGAIIDNWYDYFFQPVGTRTVLIFDDLPVYAAATITVTIDAGSGTASLGTLLAGRALDLGSTENGASAGMIDFSRKVTDDFGVTTVVERSWSKRMTARTMTSTAFVDTIQRELAKLRATPALWIGEDGLDVLAIYGFFKDFSLDLAFANVSYCSLTVEGLT